MNITGKVTKDAVVRTTAKDKKVVSFSVAVNEGSYINAQGQRITETDFYDCAFWRGTGIAPYLTKGMLVELKGRIRPKAWQDSEGKIHAELGFRASEIKLHGQAEKKAPRKSEGESLHAEQNVTTSTAPQDDDLPF